MGYSMTLENSYMPIPVYLMKAVTDKIEELRAKNPSAVEVRAAGNGAACQLNCTGSCQTSCSTGCSNTCTGGCKDGCKGTCKGSCKGGCYGSCKDSCTGNCSGSCSGGCEVKCQLCQTYCQKQQTYIKNGGTAFNWSSTIGFDKTINISAKDWNLLAGYIEKAAGLCSSSGSISISRVKSNDPISAAAWNSLRDGLAKISSAPGSKIAKESIIYAKDFSALQNNYNSTLILSNKECCQLGEACMTQASGRPSLQPCNQSPLH